MIRGSNPFDFDVEQASSYIAIASNQALAASDMAESSYLVGFSAVWP